MKIGKFKEIEWIKKIPSLDTLLVRFKTTKAKINSENFQRESKSPVKILQQQYCKQEGKELELRILYPGKMSILLWGYTLRFTKP